MGVISSGKDSVRRVGLCNGSPVIEQKEMYLDEALVIQQLRYTGMLETVRIRRSGYGAKYTFQVL